MQIDQVILRPKADAILLQHTDSAGRSGVTVFTVTELDGETAAAFGVVLNLCQGRLPPEPEKPPQAEVEQEIAELEYRLEHLKKTLQVGSL